MTSPIQEIKEKLDIVDFLRAYITLQPAGKNFKALCPFHSEKTPSFIISPERQTWHCFGACSEGGDIFKFLMKYENLEFYEALKILAEKAGIELRKTSPTEHKQFGVLFDINQAAKDFFKKQLENSPESLSYLKNRGLSEQTINEFELGLSLADYDKLTRHLIGSGFDIKDIERAGLNFRTDRGSYIDRFRERIIFPIHNHFGKVVGFSARMLPSLEALKPELGKYINSPETLIFNKSKILYGFHKSKESIRQLKSAVLVEGQMDFLLSYQDGIKNVIATSGTALTADHLKSLRRLAEQLVFCFDNDEAGLKAAERAIDLANASDFNVKLLVLEDYKDPAEAVQKSPGKLIDLISKAESAMEFYFGRYLNESPKSQVPNPKFSVNIDELKKKVRIVLSKIKNLASPIEQAHWMKELSLKTKMEEKALTEEMEQLKIQNYAGYNRLNAEKFARPSALSDGQIKLSRRDLICQRLISLALRKDDLKCQINGHLDYLPNDYLIILKSLIDGEKLNDERLGGLFNLICLRSSFESGVLDEEKIDAEFKELLYQLRLEYLKEKRGKLAHLVKDAETNGDEMKIVSALKEFDEVSKLMQGV